MLALTLSFSVLQAKATLSACFKPTRVSSKRARILIVATALLPLISQVGVGPLMERARVAGDMARFGMLHGVAGGLFLLACIGALLLVWDFNRREG